MTEPTQAERVDAVLRRKDLMSLDEANEIAHAIDGEGNAEIHQFLEDMILRDGTATEAKFAAIIRGVLFARARDQQYEAEQARIGDY